MLRAFQLCLKYRKRLRKRYVYTATKAPLPAYSHLCNTIISIGTTLHHAYGLTQVKHGRCRSASAFVAGSKRRVTASYNTTTKFWRQDQSPILVSHKWQVACRAPTNTGVSRLGILGRMKASDQLNEEQQRQMLFDLDSAYNQFHKLI